MLCVKMGALEGLCRIEDLFYWNFFFGGGVTFVSSFLLLIFYNL